MLRADASSGIDFNVSHTRDFGLIGVALALLLRRRAPWGGALLRSRRAAAALLLHLLTRAFGGGWRVSPPGFAAIFRYWTCKEAMSKATGDGLAAPFRRLDVELAETPRLLDGWPPSDRRGGPCSRPPCTDLVRNEFAIWSGA